ncbi:hypothetical protein B0T25DRAFT_452278 [Lasiosphaeria hispida]|uniref:Ubiquitin carboxyl-terminal hydrolase 19 n=1 Tax=Lasiosphaeria hispida TaxID=260671 RepID=A0AAJ0HM89_9PEZI|nr:hypothetical protein B0T25DRAFT_452278 [Lasiosphaeria hispida]
MDPRFIVTREEFHDVQMELRRVNSIQHTHSERLRLLEKRQADDAALKSVWNSPFPSAVGGTPQHGPLHMSHNEVFSDGDDFDESHTLLRGLQLDAEDEPIRRGAASRANSVRFDESALQGANWGAQSGRHSGDFGPIRPSSGMGGHHMMERSLSHKSDGRHSSAGHSVHSMHSGVSGRASSLGLDTNFMIGADDDDSPIDYPEPAPGLHILGSPPSIIRCWLTTDFTSSGLLYAVVCTGSQKSTVEYSLLKDLDLVSDIQRDLDGAHRITLTVFLAEARATQSNSRPTGSSQQLPNITCYFEVTGMEQQEPPSAAKSIRVFIGSHTLRLHSADLLLSQNSMTLYGNDRAKISVPFARPEDDAVFKNLTTANILPDRPRLNAAAPEFVSGDKSGKGSVQDIGELASPEPKSGENSSQGLLSPTSQPGQAAKTTAATSVTSESGGEGEKHAAESPPHEVSSSKEGRSRSTDGGRREPSSAIKAPWRQTAIGGDGGSRDSTPPLSGYQPAPRTRSMKVLRPTKASSSPSARIGAAYEPAPASRSSGEQRRKGQAESSNNSSSNGSTWGTVKRSTSVSTVNSLNPPGGIGDGRLQPPASAGTHEASGKSSVPRSANNPLGSASAFSWIGSKKPPTAATD